MGKEKTLNRLFEEMSDQSPDDLKKDEKQTNSFVQD